MVTLTKSSCNKKHTICERISLCPCSYEWHRRVPAVRSSGTEQPCFYWWPAAPPRSSQHRQTRAGEAPWVIRQVRHRQLHKCTVLWVVSIWQRRSCTPVTASGSTRQIRSSEWVGLGPIGGNLSPVASLVLSRVFVWPRTVLREVCSLIFNNMLADVTHRFSHLLNDVAQPWMDHELYAEKVASKGAPVNNIWGFVDGTLQHVCRPGADQREFFSGHKRKHGLKFQHIMLPNGLVCHSYGPFPGWRHDASLYGVSGVHSQLAQIRSHNGTQLAMYGNQAYPLCPWLLTPYLGDNLSAQQQHFNTSMSPLRTAVEWGFAKLTTYFAFVNFYANLKMHLQPIGHYFQTAMLLANCHTCFYGSEVATYFDLAPPPLDLYLQWSTAPAFRCTTHVLTTCRIPPPSQAATTPAVGRDRVITSTDVSALLSFRLTVIFCDGRVHYCLLSLTKKFIFKVVQTFNDMYLLQTPGRCLSYVWNKAKSWQCRQCLVTQSECHIIWQIHQNPNNEQLKHLNHKVLQAKKLWKPSHKKDSTNQNKCRSAQGCPVMKWNLTHTYFLVAVVWYRCQNQSPRVHNMQHLWQNCSKLVWLEDMGWLHDMQIRFSSIFICIHKAKSVSVFVSRYACKHRLRLAMLPLLTLKFQLLFFQFESPLLDVQLSHARLTQCFCQRFQLASSRPLVTWHKSSMHN